MSDDPFPQLRVLKARIDEVASNLGLDIVTLEFIPHGEHGNLVHFIANVTADSLKTNEEVEKDNVDAAFDELMGGLDVTVDDDGEVTLDDHEVEPEDPALEEAELAIQERARERARQALQESSDDDE